ncbi:putative penicillin-binding protein PbpX [Oxobacter pfennigii]|uniref:Putative penicillin-binding protein PbpX n=1 Tax=Oxobacter pfennigii TaxID=36849 RepID=A0A0P8Y7W5_9CLOT|nr:serine hydrolase domain-containing protein [Oxobacter pfennigii]KPU42676.1 putative penicillin-binding protein PbpX [Oxobacter pfennigii]
MRRYRKISGIRKVLFIIFWMAALVLFINLDKVINMESGIKDISAVLDAEHSTPGDIELKADEYIKIYESSGWFSGSVLMAKKGEIILNKGYGMANYELGVFNTPKTKFHLGSLTKQFTAMAIMQLEEKGLLSVEDKLSKYIADYPNGNKITIHMLLTHTSGIPDYINDDDSFNSISKLPHSITQIIDRFKNKPLEFTPGKKYDYSNSGYVLLSYIIEKVSGKSYEQYLQDNIFTPLGMVNTGYDYLTPIIKDRASGYSISKGSLVNAEFFDRSNLQGADGLYSNTEDLYLWDRALYTEKLAKKETLDKIFKVYPPATAYGYGWTISDGEIKHFGKMDGFYTFISRDITNDITIIVLSNIQQVPLGAIARDLNYIAHEKDYKLPENLAVIKTIYQ